MHTTLPRTPFILPDLPLGEEEEVLWCGGAVIVHYDGSTECVEDPECSVPRIVHSLEIHCEDASCCGS